MNQENNTFFVGKVLHRFDSIDSTNAAALRLLQTESPPEGTTLTARHQQAGRGQRGKSWESATDQNLMLSIILYPTFLQATQSFLLSQTIALGVLDMLHTFLSEGCSLKWPNDLYVFDKKIGGILIQNSLKGIWLRHSVVGIGLNINQLRFPLEVPNPTSLALEKGNTYPLEAVQQVLFRQIEARYLQLRADKHDYLRQSYLRHLYRYKTPAHYRTPDGQVFVGTIEGVSPQGKLQLRTPKGVKSYDLQEISYLVT